MVTGLPMRALSRIALAMMLVATWLVAGAVTMPASSPCHAVSSGPQTPEHRHEVATTSHVAQHGVVDDHGVIPGFCCDAMCHVVIPHLGVVSSVQDGCPTSFVSAHAVSLASRVVSGLDRPPRRQPS